MTNRILQPVERVDGLSFMQNRVCVLGACGYSNKQIGKQLKVTESTVKVHVKAAFAILGITNRTQLVRIYGVHIAVVSHYEPQPEDRAVLDLVAEGSTNEDIGDALGLSYPSVKTTLRRLLDNVKVPNRTQLACWWLVKTGRAATTNVRETIAVTGWNDDNLERLRLLCSSGTSEAALRAEFLCNKDELIEGFLRLQRAPHQVAA